MIADIIIIAVIAAYCVYVIARRRRIAKEGGTGCGCGCAGCRRARATGCGSEDIFKEEKRG